ncbi:hypothetical protein [Actinoplanes solisilvae]|uniref:hypothetical protein n=1 Tax=Actinoplanes solisilvae TaxID=2486853 RepID=UPI000FD77169|nr:hypothetical protein [Actinoplanes solisilvae]
MRTIMVWGDLPLLLVLLAGAAWVGWRRASWMAVGGLVLQAIALIGNAAWWHCKLNLIEGGDFALHWSTYVELGVIFSTAVEVATVAGLAMLVAAILVDRAPALAREPQC